MVQTGTDTGASSRACAFSEINTLNFKVLHKKDRGLQNRTDVMMYGGNYG